MIIAVPPKTLTAANKQQLTKKGYVVIEIEEPEKVRVINAESPVQTNDYLMAALFALAGSASDRPAAQFVNELHRRLKSQESNETPLEK